MQTASPSTGVAGTFVTLTGSNFTAGTGVRFNGTPAASYTIVSATSITAVVPTGATTGPVTVTGAGGGGSAAVFTVQQPSPRAVKVVDGYRESLYGAALAVQTTPTGFGNATNGDPVTSLNGSELDAAYGYVRNDSLHVFLAGNLESNGNQLDVFIDSQAGGQNVLTTQTGGGTYNNMAGLTFDAGFTADYHLRIDDGQSVLRAQILNLTTGVYESSVNGPGRFAVLPMSGGRTGRLSINNSNTGGVNDATVGAGWPAAVVTGVEFVLPLPAIGAPTGSIRIAAMVNSPAHDFLSNQTMGPLPNGTANLGNPMVVNYNNYFGNQFFTVNALPTNTPTISSLAPAVGVAGTSVTLSGTNLSGATAVSFNGVAASSFAVNSATSITAVVPAGATSGPVSVTTGNGTGSSSSSFSVLQPTASRILLDGYREVRYGAAAALQTAATGFGNATNGSQTASLNGSELNAAYTHVSGDSLYVFLAGNLEDNGNTVDVFFDARPGGQNVLTNTNPNVDNNGLNNMAGLTFDTGFAADYYFSIKGLNSGSVVAASFASLGAGGTGVSTAATGTGRVVSLNLGGGRTGILAVDMSNTGGVNDATVPAGAPGAVVTGLEFVLPLSALGSPVGAVQVAAFINNISHDFLSNQVLGGLPAGTPNLGNLGNPAVVNFNSFAGNQFFNVTLPAAPVQVQVLGVSPAAGAVGTTVTITGTGFTGATGVSFNGTAAPGFTVNAAGTQITVTVPANATAGFISVTTSAGTASSPGSFCVQYPATAPAVSRCGAGPVTLAAGGGPASGGTYAFYTQASGGTAMPGSGNTLMVGNLTATTTYYVGITTGTGATACEGPRTAVTATLNAAAIADAGPGVSFCSGGSATLGAAPVAGQTYSWSPITGLSNPTSASPTVTLTNSTSGPIATSYTLTATTANGCTATSSVQVTVNPVPTATLTAGGATTFCQGSGVALTAPAGAGNTYQFFNGSTSLGAASATNTLTATASGSYTVVVTNAATCQATSAATAVTVNPQTTAAFTFAGSPFCQSSATNPAPTVTGTAGGTFSSAAGVSINATTGVVNLGASTPGTYTVTYSVAGPCPSSSTQSVTITAAATASFSFPAASNCAGSSATVAPVLGAGAAAGTFSSTAGLSMNASTGVISLATSAAGTYTVTNTVAASGGCAATTATTTFTVSPAAIANAGPAQTICSGASAPLGVAPVAGTTYSYSPAAGLSNAAVSNPTVSLTNTGTAPITATYTLTATTAQGCSATSTVTVTVNPRPATPAISATYNGATTTLTSSATTGNQFFLNGAPIAGATGQTFVVNGTPAQLGSYTVVTTSAQGCASLPSSPLVVTAARNRIAGASLRVFPNPTSTGVLTLELTGFRLATQLTVLDALGRVVTGQLLPAAAGTATRTLDLSGTATGVYLLRLSNADGVETRRLMRE